MQLAEFKEHDKVAIWFEPTNKDLCGWRGPGEVLSIGADEGNYSIRIQGRTLMRRPQEVGPHIAFFVFLSLVFVEIANELEMLKRYAEEVPNGVVVILGVVFSHNAKAQG